MWLRVFLFTQLVEMPLYIYALRGHPVAHRIAAAFGASALTHPVVWTVTGRLATEDTFWFVVVGAEAYAVLVEGLFLRYLGVERPFIWALGVNALSFGLGLALEHLL